MGPDPEHPCTNSMVWLHASVAWGSERAWLAETRRLLRLTASQASQEMVSSGFNERPCLNGQDRVIDQCLPLVSMCMHGYVPTCVPPKMHTCLPYTNRSVKTRVFADISPEEVTFELKSPASCDSVFYRVLPWCLMHAPSIPPCLPHLEWVLLFVCSMARRDWHPHLSFC